MTTNTASAAPRRSANIVAWTAQIVFGLLFVFISIPKLMLNSDVVAGFAPLGAGEWFILFVGACELAGGLGLVIPRLSGLAALGLTGLMIGAVITNFVMGVPAMAIVPAVLGVAFAFIAHYRLRRR